MLFLFTNGKPEVPELSSEREVLSVGVCGKTALLKIELTLAVDIPLVNVNADYLYGEWTNARITLQVTAVRTFTNQYQMADAVHNATETSPVYITRLLMNPDFADNTAEGWTLTTNETTYKGQADYNCFEIWNHTFNLYQSLPGMPKGLYRVTTQAFYRNGPKANSGNTEVNAMLYIGTETTPISPISNGANTRTGNGDWYEYETSKRVPNDMQAAAAAFNSLRR